MLCSVAKLKVRSRVPQTSLWELLCSESSRPDVLSVRMKSSNFGMASLANPRQSRILARSVSMQTLECIIGSLESKRYARLHLKWPFQSSKPLESKFNFADDFAGK